MVNILHIEVYRDLRRQGIGTALIRTLLRHLAMTELPFALQAVYSAGEEEEDAVTDAFFRSIPDFEVVKGGRYYTVTPETIWNSQRLDFISLFTCDVKPYTELSRAEMSSLVRYLEEKHLRSFLPEEDAPLIPELSLCHLENGVCTTCVIFQRSELPETINLSFLMSLPGKEEFLAGVLHEVRNRLQESYRDQNIVFSLVNQEAERITKRFILREMKVSDILTAVSFGEI